MKRPGPIGWAAAFLLGLDFLLLLHAARADSSVADEHPHLLSGWLYWASGRFAGGLDNPPLGQLLLAAPLRLLHADYLFPSDAHLLLARLPVIVMTLLLALLLAHWGEKCGGRGVGLAVLIGMCLEPDMLAHGHLATLDLPVTLGWWVALWVWRRYLMLESARAPTAARIGTAARFAACVALATLTKFSGFFLLPACWLAAMFGLRGVRPRAGATAAVLAAAVAIGLGAHLTYGFEPTHGALPQQFVSAIAGKFGHRGEGHFAYLHGRTSLRGFPEYYVVALLLKTPLPLLALAAAGIAFGTRQLARLDRALIAVPAAVLLGAFSWIGVNIGVRHVLPVIPAIVLWAALGLVWSWRRGRWTRAAAVVVVGIWAAGVVRVAPQYLASFNCIAGGPAGGHRWLLDSNLDWGQDDVRLERFLAASGRRGESWDVNPPGEAARAGRIAVDANTLHALLRRDASPYAWLRPFQPSGFAGWSWRLYDLHVEDFARRALANPGDTPAGIAYAEALAHAGEKARSVAVYTELAARGAPEVFRSAARAALDAGDTATAGDWVQRGLMRHPTDRDLHLLAERVRVEAAAPAAAGTPERAALEAGLWWAEQGDVERALPYLQRAADAAPSDGEALRALGVAFVHLGRFDAAARVFESAGPAARAELEICRALVRTESAVAGSAPAAAAELMDLATTHFQSRNYDRAAAALVQLLRTEPGNAAAMALLCEIQVRSKLRITPERLQPRDVTPRRGASNLDVSPGGRR